MQIISRTLTLTNADQGYSLATLLTAAGVPLPESRRVAGVKIQASSHDCYLVDKEGAIAMTAKVPNSFGYRIEKTYATTFEESQHPANQISLADLIVVSGDPGAKIHVWAYNV